MTFKSHDARCWLDPCVYCQHRYAGSPSPGMCLFVLVVCIIIMVLGVLGAVAVNAS